MTYNRDNLPEAYVYDGVVRGYGKKTVDWGTQAFVAAMPIGNFSDEIGIVVSFRGSDNAVNWIKDFEALVLSPENDIYSKCKDCRVHEGFYKSWVSVAESVISKIRDLRVIHSKAEIYVTGHSLGAAMAALAAVHLYYGENMPVRYVYTYGQPRVGNAAFHHFYNNGTSNNAINGSSYRVRMYTPNLRLRLPRVNLIISNPEFNLGGSLPGSCPSSSPTSFLQLSAHFDRRNLT